MQIIDQFKPTHGIVILRMPENEELTEGPITVDSLKKMPDTLKRRLTHIVS